MATRPAIESVAIAAIALLLAESPDAESLAASLWVEGLYVDNWLGSDMSVVGGDARHARSELDKRIAAGTQARRPPRQGASREQHLMHGAAVLLFLGAVPQLKDLRLDAGDLATALTALQEAQQRLQSCGATTSAAAREMLARGLAVFQADAETRARTYVVHRIARFNRERAQLLQQFQCMLLRWIDLAQSQSFFEFLPKHLVTNALELSEAFSVLPPIPDSKLSFSSPSLSDFFGRVMQTTSALLGDARILNPDLPVDILTTVTALLSVPANIRIIEQSPALSHKLVRGLLQACTQLVWPSCVESLSRIVVGQGFAFAACSTMLADLSVGLYDPACHSESLREVFLTICRTDPAVAGPFINCIFNAVGWAVTEFDQILDDIRQQPVENADNKMRYRRCLRMFDVIVSLLRLLEMLAHHAQFLFLGDAGEINISRLSQIALHLLYRTTGDSLFGTVIGSHAVALQSINRTCALCPLVSMLHGLYLVPSPAHALVQRTFFGDASFTPALLQNLSAFLVDLQQRHVVKAGDDAVLAAFLADLARDFSEFQARPAADTVQDDVDDDQLCTICCTNALSATFHPCGHHSCRLCITRHLLNNDRCFFCNTVVASVTYFAADGSEAPAAMATDGDATGGPASSEDLSPTSPSNSP